MISTGSAGTMDYTRGCTRYRDTSMDIDRMKDTDAFLLIEESR
jgi:hypothetical protein